MPHPLYPGYWLDRQEASAMLRASRLDGRVTKAICRRNGVEMSTDGQYVLKSSLEYFIGWKVKDLQESGLLEVVKNETTPKQFLDIDGFKRFLAKAVSQYSESAPRLSGWLEEMYIRLGEPEWKTITLEEIQQIQYLHADGCWLGAEWAQNNIYRMLNRQGKDTTKIAGF